jgi:hypothetical protein
MRIICIGRNLINISSIYAYTLQFSAITTYAIICWIGSDVVGPIKFTLQSLSRVAYVMGQNGRKSKVPGKILVEITNTNFCVCKSLDFDTTQQTDSENHK